MTNENLSEEEAKDIIRGFQEGRSNVHTFFTNVVKAEDTTKTGNLSTDELGLSHLPVRTYKELELFSRDIADEESWADYFQKMAEIQTSTSLSKDAILMKLVVTTKKELADMTPKDKKKNKGWFKKDDAEPQQTQI